MNAEHVLVFDVEQVATAGLYKNVFHKRVVVDVVTEKRTEFVDCQVFLIKLLQAREFLEFFSFGRAVVGKKQKSVQQQAVVVHGAYEVADLLLIEQVIDEQCAVMRCGVVQVLNSEIYAKMNAPSSNSARSCSLCSA